MNEPDSHESFIDKWRQRWPEWGLLSVFVPAGQRARLSAWMALLQEIREAAWGGQDPTPGLAKLAWWQEELRGWERGARRHPLGEALRALDVHWELLGRSLAALPATRSPEVQGADEAALRTFAAGMLACEADLFDGGEPRPDDLALVVRSLRAERALAQGADVDLQAARLLQSLNPTSGGASLTRPRRLQQAIVAERLRLLAAGGATGRMPQLRLLLAGWRAARA